MSTLPSVHNHVGWSSALTTVTEPLKRHPLELAIFGGPRAFHTPLHVGRPNVVSIETCMERIQSILRSGWLANNGPWCQKFEEAIAAVTNTRHCVATCNGTVALELAIEALAMHGEVIVPSMTFAATAHAIAWRHAQPVFVDIDRTTWTIDPQAVRRAITPRTSGILAVHLFGEPCDMEPLEALARECGIPLLLDASHALGCRYQGRAIGSFGSAETFSFHATKFIHATEGGAITTNDDALAERLRRLRNFGFSASGPVAELGTNGKLNEISAAIGLTTLESMQPIIEANRANFHQYERVVRGIPGLTLHRPSSRATSNYQYVVATIDATHFGVTRDELVLLLQAENVLVRRYFYPGCHRMPPHTNAARVQLPVTEQVLEQVIALPTGLQMERSSIEALGELLRFIADNSPSIRALLTTHADELESQRELLAAPLTHESALSASPTSRRPDTTVPISSATSQRHDGAHHVVDWQPNNTEVYCYLKSQLAAPYRIESCPSPHYFSEWQFCYRICRDSEEIACWQGDFRELEPGELAQQARHLLNAIGASANDKAHQG